MLHESCGVKNQCLYILRYTVHLYILSNSICCRHNGHHRLKKKNKKQSSGQIVSALFMVYAHSPEGRLSLLHQSCHFIFFVLKVLRKGLFQTTRIGLIENTEALTDPLLYRQFFVNILIYMSSYICMQACILFFTLYVAACNGRLQC